MENERIARLETEIKILVKTVDKMVEQLESTNKCLIQLTTQLKDSREAHQNFRLMFFRILGILTAAGLTAPALFKILGAV